MTRRNIWSAEHAPSCILCSHAGVRRIISPPYRLKAMNQGLRSDTLAGKTILAVFAHPDDESLACGGTLALCARQGAKVVVMSLTRGERAFGGAPSPELGAQREQELRAAADVLGVSEVIVCGHPDGYLPWARAEQLFRDIESVVGEMRPDAVLTFGKDGLCWHHDHIVVHEFVLAVTSRANQPPPVYCATLPAGLARRIVERSGAACDPEAPPRLFGIDIDTMGTYSAPPTLNVDVKTVVAQKLAALRCHQSQIPPGSPFALLSDADAEELLGVEHFHRPAPSSADLLLLEHTLPTNRQ
jgi:LmbE family N-acetylglucosaminyl deacetylase